MSRENTTLTRKPVALLLSINPEHVLRIFEGSKHFELRKSLPTTDFGRVYLYETGGAGIVGWFDVGRIIKKSIGELWTDVGNAATTRERFFNYFALSKEGFAIEIRNASRFAKPVSMETLKAERVRLEPPQQFIILDPGQPLYLRLESERSSTLHKALPRVTFQNIATHQRPTYKGLVMKHISPHYEQIDRTFASSTLRVHDLGFDPAGFFTTKKQVLAIYTERHRCVGFTTLTIKSGGCVKTGPTIIFPRYRRRGYGQSTRKAIEERVLKQGARKIYCTCPDTSEPTMRYLLASGMRVEAHLELHYATDHGELVFGKLLVADESTVPSSNPPPKTAGNVQAATDFNRNVLIQDFIDMFQSTWSARPTPNFAAEIISQAVDNPSHKHHEKPKRMVCIGAQNHCIAGAVLLPKRGGAVKAMVLRNTSDQPTIVKLITRTVDEVVHLGGRKLYILHPLTDAAMIVLLHSNAFKAEGLLRAPYVPGQDVIVMSRFV